MQKVAGIEYAIRCESRFIGPQNIVGKRQISPTLREEFCAYFIYLHGCYIVKLIREYEKLMIIPSQKFIRCCRSLVNSC